MFKCPYHSSYHIVHIAHWLLFIVLMFYLLSLVLLWFFGTCIATVLPTHVVVTFNFVVILLCYVLLLLFSLLVLYSLAPLYLSNFTAIGCKLRDFTDYRKVEL